MIRITSIGIVNLVSLANNVFYLIRINIEKQADMTYTHSG